MNNIKNVSKNIFNNIFFKSKIIFCLLLCFIFLSGCERILLIYSIVDYIEYSDERTFKEIENKCKTLETTYFLDYLSQVNYSHTNGNHKILIHAMRDFNIAIDPFFRAAPLQAIKNLNKLNDEYNFDIISKYVDIDANASIKDLEYKLILKYNYKKNNKIYFGRLNNSTPISFQLIDKIGEDYLLLQNSVFDLQLKSDEVYNNNECILNENDCIKNSFSLEKDMIKKIFIFSEKDYKKYNKVSKRVEKYLDIELNKKTILPDFEKNEAMSENCEIDEKHETRTHTYYWIKDDDHNIANKVYKNKIFDANNNERYAIRLAILVKGDLNEK